MTNRTRFEFGRIVLRASCVAAILLSSTVAFGSSAPSSADRLGAKHHLALHDHSPMPPMQAASECVMKWDNALGQPGLPGVVRAMSFFDDGTGPAIYVLAGDFHPFSGGTGLSGRRSASH